jgi:hypothetical protein
MNPREVSPACSPATHKIAEAQSRCPPRAAIVPMNALELEPSKFQLRYFGHDKVLKPTEAHNTALCVGSHLSDRRQLFTTFLRSEV